MISITAATLITVAGIIVSAAITWAGCWAYWRRAYADGLEHGKAGVLERQLERRADPDATAMLPAPAGDYRPGRHAGPPWDSPIERWLNGEDLHPEDGPGGPVSYAQLAPWPDGLDATITDWAAGMLRDIRTWKEDT
jgi:hypothetical protein